MRSTEAFDAVQIISIKRDKGTLTPEQIDWTIDAYTRGAIADEQMAALNMAILLNGMDRAEISDAELRDMKRHSDAVVKDEYFDECGTDESL